MKYETQPRLEYNWIHYQQYAELLWSCLKIEQPRTANGFTKVIFHRNYHHMGVLGDL
jgi:hypothetical protein